MQQGGRRDPYPWTWEIPTAIAVSVVLLLVLGVHVGRWLANGFAGAGWQWTPRSAWFTSVVPILTGHARAGLPSGPAVSSTALWVWITVTETVMVAAAGWAGWVGWARFGPGRVRGMASRAEVEGLLGVSRLRRVRAVVRPDLYRRAER